MLQPYTLTYYGDGVIAFISFMFLMFLCQIKSVAIQMLLFLCLIREYKICEFVNLLAF